MNITLQCHYCGSEEVKMTFDEFAKTANDNSIEIKCKCGKWLLKDGIMGHKHNAHK